MIGLLLGALLSITAGINANTEISVNEKIAAFEAMAIERDRKRKDYLIEECGIEPHIYDEATINTPDGKLYHFRVNTHPLGLVDSSYIVRETPIGMKCVFAYEPSERDRYNIYDGGYVQNIGESSATSAGESIYFLSDDIETVYTFDQDDLRSYEDFGYIWLLKDEKILLDYLEKDDLKEIAVYQLMVIDDIRVWYLWHFNDTEPEIIKSVNEKLSKAGLPENTVFCKDREEFKKVCKSLLKDKGFNVDKFFSKEPLLGYVESEMWDLPRRY